MNNTENEEWQNKINRAKQVQVPKSVNVELKRIRKQCSGGHHKFHVIVLDTEVLGIPTIESKFPPVALKRPIIVQLCTRCTFIKVLNDEIYGSKNNYEL